jgi:Fic-DOC domain mobile mystery protein B
MTAASKARPGNKFPVRVRVDNPSNGKPLRGTAVELTLELGDDDDNAIKHTVAALCGDVHYWIENNTYDADEIAVRFHHRLTFIHPFPNGNGRHARLIADILLIKLGRSAFTWGSANLVKEGEARTKYLEGIRAADNGDIGPLLKFARS